MSRPARAAVAAKRRAFLDRTARIFGCTTGEAEALLSAARKPSVRLNPLRSDPSRTFGHLTDLGVRLDPVPWAPLCFHLSSEVTTDAPRDKRLVTSSGLFEKGMVQVQNASSFVPPLALDPHRGQAILDVAAAPGGKASHIAAITLNEAELWLNDPIPARARKLKQLVERYGVRYSRITEHPGQYVDKFIDATFDAILLDAQCSGEGMLDLSHPDALRYWSVARIEKYRRLQQRMVASAFKLLRPGGTLVYSTCTFGPEENEHPIDHLLRHSPAADVLPIEIEVPGRRPGMRSWLDERYDGRLGEAVRIMPSEHFEGFFVCKLTKKDA